MLRLALIASVAAVCAIGAAQAVGAFETNPPPQGTSSAAPQADVAMVTPTAPSGAAEVDKSPDGHYWANADVNGHQIRFLVDTGATAVALTADDARRLGLDPGTLTYSYSVTTANGIARAAPVKLESVAVGSARITQVDAFVLDHGLETSLLGMTYLGRLSRFEATPTSLILHP